jgi:hypothetical protein
VDGPAGLIASPNFRLIGENPMKNIPDEKQLEQLLETVPPNPSARINTRLAAAPWTRRATVSRRISAAISLAVLTLAILVAATPQGRAWAQEIIYFFTRADSNNLPLQSWQLTPIPENSTPDAGFIFNQAVIKVEQQAGFHVLEPTSLPDNLSFDGASYEPEHNIVRISYRDNQGEPDDTNGLVLRQESFQIADDCELCGVVGASAVIEMVQIGSVTGEYVVGVWKLTDNGPVWESDPYLQTLRWQANGIAFELLYMGTPESITKADLIATAESIK